MTTQTPLLEMRQIRKEFPGVLALDDVDFDLYAGEVHALLGENGAGKSTLIKVIAGLYHRDAGSMLVEGEEVDFMTPADSIEKGIKVVYQELDLVPGLSVAENVYLGNYPHTRMRTVDWRKLKQDTAELLQGLGLEIDPTTPVGNLRIAEQQLVEIARALSRQTRIIIMDEPTSALSPGEIEYLFTIIRRLRERNVGIIYISHKLDEIYEIADRVTVFRDGKLIVTKPVAETQPQDLVTYMVGREMTDLFPKTVADIGQPLLTAHQINSGRLKDFDVTVNSGEVVGIFGLMGAGIHSVGRALMGDAPRTGEVKVDGQTVRPGSPSDALKKGMALLTENRREDGLVPLLSVESNLTLAALPKLSRAGWIQKKDEVRAATEHVNTLSIKTPSLSQQIRLLSGGNQQKALMARWLLLNPKVLLLSEPTRGIDVGAKAEIYRLINGLAHRGIGVLVMSTELQEVLGIADRIIVMFDGRVVSEFTRSEATQERLIDAAAGIVMEQQAEEVVSA
ncbi:MAG: sugar ABC transporter ATP-binding protein [Chloroflexi bacterium]|nr:sugar ABC transporter ATP-binding protein [Chloroflexota bacterium]